MMKEALRNLTAAGGLIRVRAGIALSLTGAIVYLFVNGDPVPADLQKLWILATTLYFAPRIGADAAAATTAANGSSTSTDEP